MGPHGEGKRDDDDDDYDDDGAVRCGAAMYTWNPYTRCVRARVCMCARGAYTPMYATRMRRYIHSPPSSWMPGRVARLCARPSWTGTHGFASYGSIRSFDDGEKRGFGGTIARLRYFLRKGNSAKGRGSASISLAATKRGKLSRRDAGDFIHSGRSESEWRGGVNSESASDSSVMPAFATRRGELTGPSQALIGRSGEWGSEQRWRLEGSTNQAPWSWGFYPAV